MELHQIRYFLAVLETSNFTRAAERCHVSQPALTTAIKKLEQELGSPLFLRERRGVKLTSLGSMIVPRFRRIARESSSILETAESHQRLEQTPLRVGILETIGPARLSAFMADFRARAPGVELELRVEAQQALNTMVEEAELECVITHVCGEPPEWSVIQAMYEETYRVALPPGHPLSGRDQIELTDLSGEPYIDRLACELRDRVTATCAARSVELYAIYRTRREAWIECLVRAGVGFALLPESSIISPDTVSRPLVDPVVSRTISLVRSADRPVSPAARVFWDTLRDKARGGDARSAT
ncbi:MAG: LysR family transcriptional regulator [Myxococcota bacterium]